MPDRGFAFLFLYSASRRLARVIILGIVTCGNGLAQQQPLPSQPPEPLRIFTIQGQVSLPDGRPAVHALVTLTNSGSRRQTYSGEEGRFEFPAMLGGSYSLTATSTGNSQLVSETVDTNTNRTATSRLNVNLILREASDGARKSKPHAITAAEATQRIPKEARKAFLQGLRFKEDGERDKALERLSRALELFPEYFQALSERGDLYVIQRKLDEAAADFAKALKVDDHYGPALRGSGYCKLENREFAKAIDDFERSISAEPDNANTYLLLGIANLELDRREPARQALQRALSFTTQAVPRAHIYLANLFALEHQYQQAADELRKYLDAEPAAADAKGMREMEARWRARAAGR
jgi:Tfp pilus assembly protein PilF